MTSNHMCLRDVEVYLVLLQLALSCPELFELVVNDTGKACGFIVAVLHFSAPHQPCPSRLERALYEFSLSHPRASGTGSANCFYNYDFTSDLSCMLKVCRSGASENVFTALCSTHSPVSVVLFDSIYQIRG